MAIDTKPFVELAEARRGSTHFEGCEHYHASCAILYLAGALDAAQKRLDQRSVLIEQLIGENEDYSDKLEGARAEIERLKKDRDNEHKWAEFYRLEDPGNNREFKYIYYDKWKACEAEIERLRAENAEARAFNAPLIRDWDNEAEDEAWRGLGNA